MDGHKICFRAGQARRAGCQEKPAGLMISKPYRKPTQVVRRKYAKVNK